MYLLLHCAVGEIGENNRGLIALSIGEQLNAAGTYILRPFKGAQY
jgi:hypothetical protein